MVFECAADFGRDRRMRAAVAFAAVCVFALFCRLGSMLSFPAGGAVILSSPFAEGFGAGCARLCAPDFAALLIFTLCRGIRPMLAACFAVFSLRGAAMGACAAFCVQNSAPYGALGIMISYGAVTALCAVYCVMLSGLEDTRGRVRALCYFTVSGAAAVLRIIPYLFL